MIRTVKLDIRKGEYLSDALRRHGKENIPTRVILNKVLPGLGATYCEIMSPRSSIIIEPNVPVIVGKMEKHKNLLVFTAVSRLMRWRAISANIPAAARSW